MKKVVKLYNTETSRKVRKYKNQVIIVKTPKKFHTKKTRHTKLSTFRSEESEPCSPLKPN
jgi:hypothetical protein